MANECPAETKNTKAATEEHEVSAKSAAEEEEEEEERRENERLWRETCTNKQSINQSVVQK